MSACVARRFGHRYVRSPDLASRQIAYDRRVNPVLRPAGDISLLLARGIDLQAIASERGLHNVFADNGYQELVLLTLFGLRKLRREGNDAADAEGRQYELKTVSRISSDGIRKRSLGITTEHTLTYANIERYRLAYLWIVAVFAQSTPELIYEIAPGSLEPFFHKWERQLREQDPTGILERNHINNPKIPLLFIQQHGMLVWPEERPSLPDGEAQLTWGE